MSADRICGYAGRILRVDLTREHIGEEVLDEATRRRWLGGVGYGAKILYDEVPPGVQWDYPENRIIVASGPLGGTMVGDRPTSRSARKGA